MARTRSWLRLVDLRGQDAGVHHAVRKPSIGSIAADAVRGILDDVRMRGDAAVREFTERFDGIAPDSLPESLEVPTSHLDAALVALDQELREALVASSEQVRWFHERARPEDWAGERDGARMGVWWRAVRRAGIYVPGGKAAYPSTVIMTVVPAQVAGVSELVLCSPPQQPDGLPNATVLAAARLLGVDRVFAIGGAQAIAAMAYGTKTVPAVDKIVGPGNQYVAAAKRLVSAEGSCGIDTIAGPTEIAIVADDTGNADLIAADLVAQAEHDELASCTLITNEQTLIDRVEQALDREVAATKHNDRVMAALSGQGSAVLVDDVQAMIDAAEALAPEHLEVHTANAADVAKRIRYAGTTFIGADTPVSLGDYAAGPNHTLPTSGTARFSGGLSTSSFLVPVNWVEYDQESLAALAPSVRTLAAAEDLPAHARAVDIRLEEP